MRRSRYVTRRTSCSSASPFACRADHLPGTRRHPQCPRLHAGRPGQSCHLGSRPLSRTQPGHGAVVLGPRDANQVAAEFAQHLQGTQCRSGLPHSRHRRSNAMGTTGSPASQHYAHRARTRRELARQTRLEHAHRLRYRTLLSAAQSVVFLAWGRFAQQMVEGKLAATGAGKATGKFCLASTHPSPLSANRATQNSPPYGIAPLLRCQSATRTARLDPRQLDLPRLKIDTSKMRPTAFHRARFLFGPNKLRAAGLAAID